MTVLELAEKYYPQYWSRARLEALEAAGKLSAEQVAQIVHAEETAEG